MSGKRDLVQKELIKPDTKKAIPTKKENVEKKLPVKISKQAADEQIISARLAATELKNIFDKAAKNDKPNELNKWA